MKLPVHTICLLIALFFTACSASMHVDLDKLESMINANEVQDISICENDRSIVVTLTNNAHQQYGTPQKSLLLQHADSLSFNQQVNHLMHLTNETDVFVVNTETSKAPTSYFVAQYGPPAAIGILAFALLLLGTYLYCGDAKRFTKKP